MPPSAWANTVSQTPSSDARSNRAKAGHGRGVPSFTASPLLGKPTEMNLETREEAGERPRLEDDLVDAGIEGSGLIKLSFHHRVHQYWNGRFQGAELAD